MKISDCRLDLAALPTKTISSGEAKNFAAEWAALNPQPLPPGPDPGPDGKNLDWGAALGKNRDWAALNPQPLPPGPDGAVSAAIASTLSG
jgi:hypothetical protein